MIPAPENIINVAIPTELARWAVWQRNKVNKYETNRVIRALDTWLLLKADSVPSVIFGWQEQRDHLLTMCKCTDNTFRARLSLLKGMGLITITRLQRGYSDIRLCSWEELGQALEIDTTKKEKIQYDITSKERIIERIIAAEISDNQTRQDYMIQKSMDKNPEIKMAVIGELIRFGADRNRLDDPGYLLSMLRAFYLHDFQSGSEIHDVLVSIRPENNRSVRGMADAWKCKHPSTVSYWKKKMCRSGVIELQKIQVQSNDRIRNRECKVVWLKGPKQTLLCLCDRIEVLRPWLCTEKFDLEGLSDAA